MTPTGPRKCLCGCPALFRRPRSLPLCRAATVRATAALRSLPLRDEPNAASRRSNRFWIDERTVLAALAGDLAEAERRVRYRADHGLHADPDSASVAIRA